MNLQLEQIQGYLAHGLMIKYYSDRLTIIGEFDLCDLEYCLNNSKPILRKLDLTKLITVNGVEIIPIVELAKISYPDKIWYFERNNCYSECGLYFYFDYKNFYCMGINNPLSVYNQLQLFKWLYANKFDVEGLIDAGLAIDADTLETNPYNS